MEKDSNNKKFASGLCFYKIFIIFMVGSVLGSVYEELYNMIWTYLSTGEFVFSLRQGVIYGPFNIIYGLGAAVMVKYLVPKRKKWLNVFVSGALMGGLVEFAVSLFQEKIFGTISWNYANKFLNIDGRTTIPYMLFWGLCGLFAVYKLYPFLSKKIEEVPYKFGKKFTDFLIVFITIDMIISFVAVYRRSLRDNGVPPYTFIGEVCDRYYTDPYLDKIYPTTEVVNK